MVRLHLTEKSYRKDFIIKLDGLLEPHDLVLFDDASLSYVDAENNENKTRFPDIVIAHKDKVHREGEMVSIAKNGVLAVIETKKAAKSVYDGFTQALAYMGMLDAKHAFATNFKDVVGFQLVEGKPKIDERLTSAHSETAMDAVIDFIIGVLIYKKELHPVELNDNLVVKILESSVSEILGFIHEASTEKLEEPIGFFFAKKLDTKILTSPKSKKEFDLAIRKATAYLVVNQILFYHILSTESGSKYDKIERIEAISDLQKNFDKVLIDDYSSIFSAKVSRFLNADSLDAINSILKAVNVLKLERIKHDILGKIFHGLIPQELRKRIAAYYTSNAAGDLLANLCIEDKDAKILDPACGSGTLLVSSYKRKKELYGEETKGIHKKLLSQIIGGDISIFAAHLAAIHLALQEPLSYTEEVHIILGDFFDISPKKTLVDWLNQTKQVKQVSAEKIRNVEFNVPLVDLIIMNPPFTRMELLDKKYKEFIENSFTPSPNKEYVSKRMGLHALFLLHADDFLKRNGRVAAVLPASTFYTGYGEKLEQFLLSKYRVKYVITSDVETTFSEQSTFKEILLIVEKSTETKQLDRTLFVALKVPLTLKNAKELSEKISKVKEDIYEDNEIRVRTVFKRDLATEKNWMTFIEKVDRNYATIASAKNIVTAKKYLDGKISEGIRRFPPNFFYLPNASWEIVEDGAREIQIKHKQTKEELSISKKLLIPSLRKPEIYSTIRLKPSHYILAINPSEKLNSDMERYILLGEKQGMNTASNTLIRETKDKGIPWYSYTYMLCRNLKVFGQVFLIYKLRFNTAKIIAHYVPENITGGGMFLIIKTKSDDEAKIITAWYNSIIYVLLMLTKGRAISGAYFEALITDVKKLPMLDISKLDDETKKKIINTFDKYSAIKLPSFPKQIESNSKEELDLVMLKALGVNNPEKMLKQIYKYVSDKIETLKLEVSRK